MFLFVSTGFSFIITLTLMEKSFGTATGGGADIAATAAGAAAGFAVPFLGGINALIKWPKGIFDAPTKYMGKKMKPL